MSSENGIRLPARSTRGKRMSKLVDDEIEAAADDEFWNQEAFQEGENDNEYEEEKEAEDIFDSDFDEDEPESDEDKVADEDKRPIKKRKILLGSKPFVPKKVQSQTTDVQQDKKTRIEEAADLAAEGLDSSGGESGEDKGEVKEVKKARGRRPSAKKKAEEEDDEFVAEDEDGTERRKSSRSSVVVKAKERELLKSFELPKIVRRKRHADGEKKWTQEEMLLEAAQTEILNKHSLEIMLAREEEVKKRAVIQKEIFAGPQIRFHSKDGKNTLEFTRVTHFPKEINSKALPYPKKHLCVVTGLPAKYRDPISGLPYATMDAFKKIRSRMKITGGWQLEDSEAAD